MKLALFANDQGDPPGTGQFFIAINPEKFSNTFEEKIENVVQSIKNQEKCKSFLEAKELQNYKIILIVKLALKGNYITK